MFTLLPPEVPQKKSVIIEIMQVVLPPPPKHTRVFPSVFSQAPKAGLVTGGEEGRNGFIFPLALSETKRKRTVGFGRDSETFLNTKTEKNRLEPTIDF
uniref:Uncharacterized protein n=1 Tax=Anguilla anguilla TaxID=7936 RepID=A0A0E9X1K6_ANGAN